MVLKLRCNRSTQNHIHLTLYSARVLKEAPALNLVKYTKTLAMCN